VTIANKRAEDGASHLEGTVMLPREPDAVSWLKERYLAPAD
jgi:hypothetical protein